MTVPPTNNFSKVNDSAQQHRQGVKVIGREKIEELYKTSISTFANQDTLRGKLKQIMQSIEDHPAKLVFKRHGGSLVLREPNLLGIFPGKTILSMDTKGDYDLVPLASLKYFHEAIKNYTPKNKSNK
jgi:hypothetical protein